MKKQLAVLSMVLALGMLLAGCGSDATKNPSSKANQGAAKNYPNKTVQIVVPYGAGGDTDTNARVMSKYLSKELGKPVIVTNVAGSSGVVGSQQVLDSKPDGYTVLFNHPTMLMNNLIGLTDISWKNFKNAGIGLTDDANVFVVSSHSKYKNLQDLINDAKANPGKIRFATSIGSFTHLQLLAFEQMTGTNIVAADLGDMAAYTTALLGNQIEVIGCQYGVVKDYIESGDFRCLGVMSEKRNPLIPNVPTFKEQGVDLSISKFFFYAFPKDTPDEIVNKFSAAMEKVCQNKDYIKEANSVLVTPKYMKPEDAVTYIGKEEENYKKWLKDYKK